MSETTTLLPVAKLHEAPRRSHTTPLPIRIGTPVVIFLPLAGAIAAPFSVWGHGFGWTDLYLFVIMYVLTSLGITVGFHRLFVHRSFETNNLVKFLFGVLGSMAAQGPVLRWVATHRRHHQFSDKEHDPHSPHEYGGGLLGLLQGFWHSHTGWVFKADPPDLLRYCQDLNRSRMFRVLNLLFPVWAILGLLIPAVIGGWISGTWIGFWTGLLWGGLVRIFLTHHIAWSVNSACHIWGRQPYKSDDESRNNAFFGVLAMGEGWHNTHHAFPTSARHGLRWWQVDVSYWLIRALALAGLAWNIKLPTKAAEERQRREI